MGTKLAGFECGYGLRKENPDMSAVAGAGALKGCGHALLAAGRKECHRIAVPSVFVEISRQEPASLVAEEWIDAGYKRLRPPRVGDVTALNMISHNLVANCDKRLVR